MAGNYRHVVLAGAWVSEDATHFEEQLRIAVQTIRAAGATPVIMLDNPSREPSLSHCILHRRRGWIPADTNCNIPRSEVEKDQAVTVSAIRRVAQQVPGTLVIDPLKVMCNGTECPTWFGNLAVYKDSNHINTRAAAVLGERYVREVGNPLRDEAGPVTRGQ